jgi:predicted DNA-binding transcriptional regulator AlpA
MSSAAITPEGECAAAIPVPTEASQAADSAKRNRAPKVPDLPPAFLDAEGCGHRYSFSSKHWNHLVDQGKAPQPHRFGRLVRWSLADLQVWEAGGCKPVRTISLSRERATA